MSLRPNFSIKPFFTKGEEAKYDDNQYFADYATIVALPEKDPIVTYVDQSTGDRYRWDGALLTQVISGAGVPPPSIQTVTTDNSFIAEFNNVGVGAEELNLKVGASHPINLVYEFGPVGDTGAVSANFFVTNYSARNNFALCTFIEVGIVPHNTTGSWLKQYLANIVLFGLPIKLQVVDVNNESNFATFNLTADGGGLLNTRRFVATYDAGNSTVSTFTKLDVLHLHFQSDMTTKIQSLTSNDPEILTVSAGINPVIDVNMIAGSAMRHNMMVTATPLPFTLSVDQTTASAVTKLYIRYDCLNRTDDTYVKLLLDEYNRNQPYKLLIIAENASFGWATYDVTPATYTDHTSYVEISVSYNTGALNVIQATTVKTFIIKGNAVGGGGLQNNFSAVVPPTVNDDSGAGYAVGSRWLDTDVEYVCHDATVGASVWVSRMSGYDEQLYFHNTTAELYTQPKISRVYGFQPKFYGFDYTNTVQRGTFAGFSSTFNILAHSYICVNYNIRQAFGGAVFSGANELVNPVYVSLPFEVWQGNGFNPYDENNINQRFCFTIGGATWGGKEIKYGVYTNYEAGLVNVFGLFEKYDKGPGEFKKIPSADYHNKTLEFNCQVIYKAKFPFVAV